MERRKKIAVELSDLVVYCRPVPFNEDSKDTAPILCSPRTFKHCRTLTLVPCCCCFQRSGRRERATETCPPSRRPRQRSLPHAAEGSASSSTTAGSCPGCILGARGWTHPTTTHCPCGSVARSWWHLTSRHQVSAGHQSHTHTQLRFS